MNFLLNTGWMKTLIAKAIKSGITKKAGIKADLGINELMINDSENGIKIHLDIDMTIEREELEKLLKDLM